jgi:hypothetical protein
MKSNMTDPQQCFLLCPHKTFFYCILPELVWSFASSSTMVRIFLGLIALCQGPARIKNVWLQVNIYQ